MTAPFHILVLGSGSKELCERFGECGGTRIRYAAVDQEYAEDLDTLKAAGLAADRFLQSRVDAVLLLWKPNAPKSTSLLFSMTESFRTCKDRVYACAEEEAFQSLLATPPNQRLEAQSALIFFTGRMLVLDSPGNVLKTLLRAKPKGPPLQLSILATDDFINGAIERRNARKKLFVDASGDDKARVLLEKRFWTRMGGSVSSLRQRLVV